ncbi:MAG: ATP-binding protein [Hormoscilla sp. GM102CHS1]|nr:ATP-binding protein [Hormoscilla sp. GM102CHS1]
MNETTTTTNPTADIIEVDKALESMRQSGFDLATAVGEVVDNSYEARANFIRISTSEGEIKKEGKGKQKGKISKIIEEIAFADNGMGIAFDILPKALKLGFSTRYNQRNGLGRFGVGMKLAAISQARRVDIYTQPLGSSEFYHAYLDLDLIGQGKQTHIEAEVVDGYPSEYLDLMQHPETNEPFESGTLVVWSKVDRLVDGGQYGSAIQERLQDLTKFLGRAYRKYLEQGLYIELDRTRITLHDPLFLLENPRVINNFDDLGDDLQAEIVEENDIKIDGHNVHVTVTLYPEEFRKKKGYGGLPSNDKRFQGLYIPDNEGHISILRNDREIYYDVVPKLFPSAIQDIDRFIGVEVSFPAVLDEYFQVRHVKRGAEPVDKLRQALRKFLKRPINNARKKIRDLWHDRKKTEAQILNYHESAETAVKQADRTLPKGKGGMNLSPQEQEQIVSDLLSDLKIDPEQEPEQAEEVKQKLQELPITMVDEGWPGKELFEITHLNGKAILKLNHRHPFMHEIYDPLKELAGRDAEKINPEEAIALAMKAADGLDVLFMAYAKAENLHSDPEKAYGDIRTYWGQNAYAFTREVLRDHS